MIDLRSLRYVVTLARRLSFARAAEDLGISQPALTRAVQMVEQRYGVRLFDRDRSGVRVTPQGRSLIDEAAGLLAGAEDLERQWDRNARGVSGRVRFGMAPMPARAMLSATLLERMAATPDIVHDVAVRDVEALLPMLLADEIEFFVAAEGIVPDTAAIRTETVARFSNDLIVRRGHPLLDLGADRVLEGDYPFLLSSRSGAVHPLGIPPFAAQKPQIVEDFETLVRLVRTTDAVWRTSAHAVAEEIRSGALCVLPAAEGGMPSGFRVLAWSLHRRTLSSAARALVQTLKQVAARTGA